MITSSTYVEDLVRDYPQTVTVMMKYGVICIQCGEPIWGTVGEALERKNITNAAEVLSALNQSINQSVSAIK
ncbi:MAG: DUF1858 domain-containing protein [bacterium]|nr:DUF1858 domain-containing protein [bacterium]